MQNSFCVTYIRICARLGAATPFFLLTMSKPICLNAFRSSDRTLGLVSNSPSARMWRLGSRLGRLCRMAFARAAATTDSPSSETSSSQISQRFRSAVLLNLRFSARACPKTARGSASSASGRTLSRQPLKRHWRRRERFPFLKKVHNRQRISVTHCGCTKLMCKLRVDS